jgi:hypothetical protein
MGYKKLIVFGNNAELYEYEKNLGIHRGGRRRAKSNDDLPDMATSGEAVLQERSLGKRKDSAQRASVAFRRLVLSNLDGVERPLLVTLTHAENLTDLKQGYKNYTSFIQALRYKFGKTFKYVCVPEFQRRGSVHFHALFWGLPTGVFLSERKTRLLAGLWGKGFVFLKETDGNEKLSSYLVKYMAKAFMSPELKNQKAFVASRNCKRPVSIGGVDALYFVLDDYLGTDAVVYRDRTYETHYLGKCRNRSYIPRAILK